MNERIMSVIGSSCDQPNPTSWSFLSFDLNQTSTFSSLHRSVFSHTDFSWSVDMMISSEPSFSISSATIRLMLESTRKPSGMSEYTPDICLWAYPARMRSCAFFETSSFGAVLLVLVNSLLWRIGYDGYTGKSFRLRLPFPPNYRQKTARNKFLSGLGT